MGTDIFAKKNTEVYNYCAADHSPLCTKHYTYFVISVMGTHYMYNSYAMAVGGLSK